MHANIWLSPYHILPFSGQNATASSCSSIPKHASLKGQVGSCDRGFTTARTRRASAAIASFGLPSPAYLGDKAYTWPLTLITAPFAKSMNEKEGRTGEEGRMPHQRKRKQGVSVMASISSFMISCHVQVAMSTPGARRAYSSHGGSMSTTSNLVPKVFTSSLSSRRSACTAQPVLRHALRTPCPCFAGWQICGNEVDEGH